MGYIEGIITRAINGGGDSPATLTATLTKNGKTLTKTFDVIVKEEGMSDSQIVAADRLALTIVDQENIIGNLTLPTSGPNGSTISWSSDTPDVISDNGTVVRPDNGSTTPTVILTATFTKGNDTVTKDITFTVKPWTDSEEVTAALNNLTFETIKGTNISQSEITSDLQLSTTGLRATTIAWVSSNTVIASSGVVSRPSYIEGDITVTLTATISKGVYSSVKQFIGLKVVKLPETNDEATFLALQLLLPSEIMGSNVDLQNVISDIVLPIISDDEQSVTFSWVQVKKNSTPPVESLYLSIEANTPESNAGVIIRPDSSYGNEEIVLTVTATSSSLAGTVSSVTKDYNIRIKATI